MYKTQLARKHIYLNYIVIKPRGAQVYRNVFVCLYVCVFLSRLLTAAQ